MKSQRALVVVTLLAALTRSASPQGVPSTVVDGAKGFAQPGDQVRVTVWPQSAFGAPITAIVDLDGNILVPPAGQLSVRGVPIQTLRDTLRSRLGKFIRQPEVDVQVLRRVTVNGAVLKPDVYYMDVASTLRDAIARAGGITEVGTRAKVYVIRDGVRTRVPKWETDASESSVLRSGDQVLVGRRSWLELNILPIASLGLATASFLISVLR
jgi:protein involved in polysaccharide export with SLBB domain